jgi:glycosyltransferase involved in cell wall biosynthesis/organic radical activating enzyme
VVIKKNPLISVIIPVFNDEENIVEAMTSVAVSERIELIVVDSGSNDKSASIAKNLCADINATFIQLDKNLGPGVARNQGILSASGKYIIFLDSDDVLVLDWFSKLAPFLDDSDLIPFNGGKNKDNSELLPLRKDLLFTNNKCELRERFLKHQLDGSVIFTAFKLDFILRNKIKFRSGIHEDIDFIFKSYLLCDKLNSCDVTIYKKNVRLNSITNTISFSRVESYFNAWFEIWNFNETFECNVCNSKHADDQGLGILGAIVSIAREITRFSQSNTEGGALLNHVYEIIRKNNLLSKIPNLDSNYQTTTYYRIWKKFLQASDKKEYDSFISFCKIIEGKSLSCNDIENSLFLSPNEIRTCCKRFYVDGERRGDAKLPIENFKIDQEVSVLEITKSKLRLKHWINSGQSTSCSGCPFLEFKKWDNDKNLTINYLSMEHHSICNLRCSYCSDEYFGGEKPKYNVLKTIDSLAQNKSFIDLQTVVWGGGEPTLDPNFNSMLGVIKKAAPNSRQRFLSNSMRPSKELLDSLKNGNSELVTSVDAGTALTFKLVRGRSGIEKQLSVIKEYLEASPNFVTIKYIFTEGNDSESEINSFVDLILKYGLGDAIFQISNDFKDEYISFNRATRIAQLYGLLIKSGVKLVFLDDLLQLRLNWSEHLLTNSNWQDAAGEMCANVEDRDSFIFWGNGEIANTLLSRRDFITRWGIEKIYDHRPDRVQMKVSGIGVEFPTFELLRNKKIVPLASQGMPVLLNDIKKLGFDQFGIFQKLIW